MENWVTAVGQWSLFPGKYKQIYFFTVPIFRRIYFKETSDIGIRHVPQISCSMLCRNGSEFPQSPEIQNTVSQSVLELALYASLPMPLFVILHTPFLKTPRRCSFFRLPLTRSCRHC